MNDQPGSGEMLRRVGLGAGLAIGMGIGVALGVALHNMGAGIALGVGVGAAVMVAFLAAGSRMERDAARRAAAQGRADPADPGPRTATDPASQRDIGFGTDPGAVTDTAADPDQPAA